MRLSLHTFQLHFPHELSRDQVRDVLLTIAGQGATEAAPIRFTARGAKGRVTHFMSVPSSQIGLVRRLQKQLPGLEATEVDAPLPALPCVWKLWQSSSRRPMRRDREELTARALLISLMSAKRGEQLELRWLLGPIRRPRNVGNKPPGMSSEQWSRALVTAAVLPPGDLDADARKALRDKRAEPGWRVLGQIAVGAEDRQRAQKLAASLMSAVRTSEAPGVHLGVRRSSRKQLDRRPWRWPMEMNAEELPGLLAWPLGEGAQGLPVSKGSHRRLEAATATSTTGRLLGTSPAGRAVRITDRDSLQHLHVMGPTGTGKSTLLLNLILQDIAAGRSVVVLDVKGDLVDDVLRRYPLKRLADLVVLDPLDEAPVGLNPLARPVNPGLVADQLLSIFANLFRDSFGPRTADVLHASLLTLAHWGEGSLAVLPLLLTHARLRRRIVGRTPDPLGTGPFWAWYEALSAAERQQIIAPTLNKVRPFVLRPDLRAVLGQAAPRFQLSQLVTERRVLLVNLAKGQLGPESSALLGTMLLNQLWQTILTRTSLPASQRHPIGLYLDEFQDYLRLPGDVADLLAQARSMGAMFTLAHQHLDQLPADVRSAVLANARSRVVFQLGHSDAKHIANGRSELSAKDLMGLPPYEAYASLLLGNEVQPFVSVRTAPPPAESGTGKTARLSSQGRFGVARTVTDQALRDLTSGDQISGEEPVGRRPRGQP